MTPSSLLESIGTVGFDRPDYLWLLVGAFPIGLAFIGSRRKIAVWRRVFAGLTRLLLLLLLTCAVAGITWRRPVDELAVVFVVDQSASVGAEGEQQATAFIRAALAAAPPDDRSGVVVFGSEALVDAVPREQLRFDGAESRPSPHQSDLAAGLRVASAVLPPDRAGRIVLLSDGEETRGEAAAQALLLADDDLEIAVVPIGAQHDDQVLLEDLVAPARVDAGAAYDVRVVARADKATKGVLRLYRNDTYLGEMPVELEAGRASVIPIRQEAAESGLYRYRATLEVPDGSDPLPQNNEVMGTVQVTGQPRVLYAEGYPAQAGALANTLRAEGLLVDVVDAGGVPSGVAGLRPYSAVILSDIPAYAITQRQQEALHAYVRDLGRGLVMVGGDQSFGLGGYYKTPIEQALPVKMDIEDKSRFPSLAMVHAIDKSCSMGDGPGSPLALAKEASIRTVELLAARDQLGIIGFDSAASWVLPVAPLSDKDGAVRVIASMRSGGGTDIYPAVERGNQALVQSDSAMKHIIVMSDGITAPGDFESLVRSGNAQGITLTAIALGPDADRATMQSLAGWGGGSFYAVTDPTAIPAVFTREALLASRSFLIEESFVPAPKEPSDLLRGFGKDLPPLHGYVATEAKPRAVVALQTTDEYASPLLAHWHYGLGRSVAFTSDCKSRWSKDWISTPEYTRLWSHIARWAIGDPYGGSLQVDAEIDEGRIEVTVDAVDADGSFRNFLAGEARVIAPDLTVRSLPLRQVAPGRYTASVPVDQDGSWLVGVAMKAGDELIGQAVAEAVQPYSPEYRRGGTGPGLLTEIATIGGAGVLSDPAAVFARPRAPRAVPVALWPVLVVLAGLVLLIDVAVRRLELGLGRPRKLVLVRPAATPAPKPSAPATAPPSRAARPAAAPAPTFEERAAPVVADTDTEAAPEADGESYAGRLLAARRSARDKMGKDK